MGRPGLNFGRNFLSEKSFPPNSEVKMVRRFYFSNLKTSVEEINEMVDKLCEDEKKEKEEVKEEVKDDVKLEEVKDDVKEKVEGNVGEINVEENTLEDEKNPEKKGPEKIIQLGSSIHNGVIVNQKTRFFRDFEAVYGVFKTTSLPKKKIIYTIRWICVDGFKDNPDKVLYEFPKDYDPETDTELKNPKVTHFMIIFDLKNPYKALPAGNYRVEVLFDKELQLDQKFVVENRIGLFLGVKMDKFGIDEPMTEFDGYTLLIFGLYHFDKMNKVKAKGDELGKIRWAKLKDDGSGEEKKELQMTPIKATSPTQQFDCFKFRYVKPQMGMEPGKYKVEVFVADKLEKMQIFEVKERKPRLFLGTALTKFGDVLDDTQVFPGKVKVIRGVYRFCKIMPNNSVGKIKWLLIEAEGLKKPSVIGESIIKSDKEFRFFAFKMDFSNAPQTIPGTYKCVVELNEKVVCERNFRILPTYSITLGEIKNSKIESPQEVFAEGETEVNGIMNSNKIHKKGTQVQIIWFAEEAMGIRKNAIIYNTNKKMEKDFRSIFFTCKLKKPFPIGKYLVVIMVTGAYAAAKKFRIESRKSLTNLQNLNIPQLTQFTNMNFQKPKKDKEGDF